MSDFQFGPVNVSGNAQINQGNTINANQEIQSAPLETFEKIQKKVQGEEWSADTPTSVTDEYPTPAKAIEGAIEEIKEEKIIPNASSLEQVEENNKTFDAKKDKWFQILKWLGKGSLKVAGTILAKQADKSAVLAGLKTAIDFASESVD